MHIDSAIVQNLPYWYFDGWTKVAEEKKVHFTTTVQCGFSRIYWLYWEIFIPCPTVHMLHGLN